MFLHLHLLREKLLRRFHTVLPGARNTVIVFNDASRSEGGFLVEGSGGQNIEGLVLLHNRGSVVIEGTVQAENGQRWLGPAVRAPKPRFF